MGNVERKQSLKPIAVLKKEGFIFQIRDFECILGILVTPVFWHLNVSAGSRFSKVF